MAIRISPRRISGPSVHPRTVSVTPQRHYSAPTNPIAAPINHLEYKKKYDHFVYISTEKKLERLIAQGLRYLEPDSIDISQGPIEVNWERASNRLRQRNIQLASFDKSSPVNNLLKLLPHIEIPIKKQNKEPSLSAKHWRDRKEISIPLLGEAPPDHMIVNEMLRKHLKGRIILIGAATWNSDETFRNLRYLFEHANPDLEIPFIANIEINPLNARLARLTANELGLTSTCFMSMEGNIVDGLPPIPTAFKVHRHSIIACRLLPYLAFDEISNFLDHIEKHLSETQGYCVLTYPVVSVKEFEKPTSEFFIKYSELVEMGIFKLQVLEDRKQNLIGVSFISEQDHPESGLVKGGLYQTILFQENVAHLLTKIHRFKILEKRLNIGQDQIPREATLLTRA